MDDKNQEQQDEEVKTKEQEIEEGKKGSKSKKNSEDLEKKVKELEEKVEELENNWKRALADYKNLEKRNSEERLDTIKFANRDLLLKLLPAFDTLFLAEKYTEDQGVKLTIRHMLDVLKGEGIERVEVIGKSFDANTMEAVTTEEGEEGKVLEELRPGFSLNGKLLRPANVKVGKGK